MADTKISAETAAASLDGSEVFPVVQGAANRKASTAQVKTFVQTVVVTDATTARQLALNDANSYIRFTNASAINFTIPLDSVANLPINTVVEMEQAGAGALTVVAASGVTINSRNNDLILAGQYAVAALKKVAANTWTLTGDL